MLQCLKLKQINYYPKFKHLLLKPIPMQIIIFRYFEKPCYLPFTSLWYCFLLEDFLSYITTLVEKFKKI